MLACNPAKDREAALQRVASPLHALPTPNQQAHLTTNSCCVAAPSDNAAALLWLISLAFPFFGVINDVLGAFTTTFEVIPAAQRCLRPSLPRRAAKPQSRHLLFPATFPAPPE